jgi:WD40 repeat protein
MRRCGPALLLLVLPLPARADEGATQKPTLVLDAGGHTANIVNLFFTPDGKRLISASTDSTVRVWDAVTGESLQVIHLPVDAADRAGPGGASHAAALAADGRLLALAGWSSDHRHVIYLYDLAALKVLRVLAGHPKPIDALAFSRDGKWLASGGGARTLLVWDLATGEIKYRLVGHTGFVHAVAFSPDGRLLASSSEDGTVRLWSMATGEQAADPREPPEVITGLAWSPDGKALAACGQQKVVHLYGPDGSSLGEIDRRSLGEGLSFSADGKTLLAGTSLIGFTAKKQRTLFLMPYGFPQSAALSPDGKVAASGSLGPGLFLWNTADGQLLHQLGGRGRSVSEASWGRDGRTIGWRLKHRADERTRPEGAFRLTDLTFLPLDEKDQQFAEHARGEWSLEKVGDHVLEVRRGGQGVGAIKTPNGPGGIACCTFVDDVHVAVGQPNGLFLYDVTTGNRVRTYKGAGALRSVAPAPGKGYFVAGGLDEVLRVYTTDRDAPLVSLYVAGDDWIAWTPEGYYAASPGGERLMGWQVPGEGDQLPTFHAAARFRASLYRPGVIRRLLQTRSVAKALELADKEKGQKTDLIEVQHVLPPQTGILSPGPDPVKVTEPKLPVRAFAQGVGAHPVTSLQLLLDGRPYEGRRGRRGVNAPQKGRVEKEWTVELPPGTHRISLLAKCDVSSAVSAAVEVTYEPAAPPTPDDLKPGLFVLAVGINAYPGDMRLDYAVKDATDLAKSFADRTKSIFREVRTELLTDKDATRKGVLARLDGLKKLMKPHDVAVIFYAGHGYRDEQGRFYLLTIETDPDDLDHTTVTGEELKKHLAELPGRVVLMMDACHSGAIGGRGKGLSITDDLARELADDDCGVIVMCAAMGSEESRESTDRQHGYFTLALIEGLAGAADYNKDGLIQLTELDLYVDNRVAQLSKDEQHPVTAKPTTVRSFAMTKY